MTSTQFHRPTGRRGRAVAPLRGLAVLLAVAAASLLAPPAAGAQELPPQPEINAVNLPHHQYVTGTEFTVMAVVSGDPTPTGDVALFDDSVDEDPLATATLDANGLAFLTVDPANLGLGQHALRLDYEGDEGWSPTSIFGTITEVEATQPQQYVRRLYDDVLFRNPDPGGFNYWVAQMNGGTPRATVAHVFTHSDENYVLEILFAYFFLLDRDPDEGGLAHYLDAFRRGMTNEQLDYYLASSNEFFADAGSTNAGYVDQLYLRLLGRAPDADGRAYWIALLNAGVQRRDVAYAFVFGSENLGNEIVGLYFRFLNREASLQERTLGAQLLGSGSVNYFDAQRSFVTSAEYLAKVPQAVAFSSAVAAVAAADDVNEGTTGGRAGTSANWAEYARSQP